MKNQNGVIEVTEVQGVNNSLALTGDNGESMLMNLTGARKISYSSIDESKLNESQKIDFINLINSKGINIGDAIGETILLKDVYVEMVEVSDMNTGELKTLPRIILISAEGKSYTCASIGIFKRLAQTFQSFGQPNTWKKPLKIKFKQETTRSQNKVLTFMLEH